MTLDSAQLAADYRAGKTVRDLAWKYGIGRARVLRLLRHAGVRVRPRRAWQGRIEAEVAARRR